MNPTRDEVGVSVVIACLNGQQHLRQQLEALVAQRCEKRWEVIVADNGSTDASLEIAESFTKDLDLRVVDASERSGISFARNSGARIARGEKLLFIDADDEVAPGYLEAMDMALETHAFVTSRVDTTKLNAEWNRFAHGPWQERGLLYISPDYLPVAGPNIGVRRSVFQRVGGYPEEIPIGCEDLAFSLRVQLSGIRLHFVPEAEYRYRHRDSLGALYRQTRWWGSHLPLLYREYRSAGMPRRTLEAAGRDWLHALSLLAHARTKADMARALVHLGYCVGRLKGSFRYRVLFL